MAIAIPIRNQKSKADSSAWGLKEVLYPSTALPKHDFLFPHVRSNNAIKLCWESNSLLLYALAIPPYLLVKIDDFDLKFSILKGKGENNVTRKNFSFF